MQHAAMPSEVAIPGNILLKYLTITFNLWSLLNTQSKNYIYYIIHQDIHNNSNAHSTMALLLARQVRARSRLL